MADEKFNGFPKKCLTFYRNLAKHNDKTWFEAHRSEYEEQVLWPAKLFVTALGAKLKRIAPGINAVPLVNKSIFRLNRDVRFSKDKSPYKDHLGVWLWEGEGKRMECSGFYFHLEPSRLALGAGVYMFPKRLLDEYRRSVIDPKTGPALAKAAAKVQKSGDYHLGGRFYKKTPRGFDPKSPQADFLLFNGLHVGADLKIPPELYQPDLVDLCYEHYKNMKPVHSWLKDMVART